MKLDGASRQGGKKRRNEGRGNRSEKWSRGMGRLVRDSVSPSLSPLPLGDLVSFDSVGEEDGTSASHRAPPPLPLVLNISLASACTSLDGI